MLIKMLLVAIVALLAALFVACQLFCKVRRERDAAARKLRRERDAAARKLSHERAKSAHLVGVIRVIQQGHDR